MNLPYIDLIDLPSDIDGSLGNLRRVLALAYNTSRDRPDRLKLLTDTLRYVLETIEPVDNFSKDVVLFLHEIAEEDAITIDFLNAEIERLKFIAGETLDDDTQSTQENE